MFISATTPLPHISHPASPSSHTCREALSAVRDLDERPQDTVQSRSGILHRPHFTPKEYAAVSRLSASRTSTSSIHKVHAVSRPSLPPAKDLSGRADASPSHVDFSSKGQPACIARHSTPAILPNRHTANDSLSLVNGLGLDLGLPNAAVATNDTASTRCTQTEARRPLTTSKQASDALHDIAVNAAPDAVIRLDDDGKTAIAPSHSETLPRGIDTSASLQDHMLGALLQRVDIKGAAKTPRSLTMQCTSEAHLPSGFTCQTLPLPHPEQLAHVGSEAVASSPKGRWNSTAPPFAPHRSWSHNATVEVPSASLNTTPSKVSFVNKDTSSSTINKQTAFAGHGHFSPVSASPHRHQHANVSTKTARSARCFFEATSSPQNAARFLSRLFQQSSPTSLPSATHWLVNSADHHAHWMPSSVAKTASAWMLGQEALQLLPVQIAAPCQTYTTQTYPCLSQAVPVDIPLVGTQDVYTSLLTTDAKRNFSSPPSSSTDSTPSSSNDMFVINSSPPRGVETSTGASSVEMQCKQRKESLYKTELCRGYEEKGHCDYGVKW